MWWKIVCEKTYVQSLSILKTCRHHFVFVRSVQSIHYALSVPIGIALHTLHL